MEKTNHEAEVPDGFYPPRSTVCTQAFSRFLNDYHDHIDNFFFLVGMVARVDEGRVRASRVLISGARSPEEKEKLEKSAADPDVALRQLQTFSTVQSRNLTNGAVSGFQRYFSEIIQSTALKKPEMLRSSEAVRIDEVLRFRRHKDLVSFLIDRKINELSYGGIKGMEAYFRDRLGVEMFAEDRQRALLTAFIELRNINVHNGGIVNDLFLSKAPTIEGFKFIRGRPFNVNLDRLMMLAANAIRIALGIDEAVASKFKLKRQSHKLWIAPSTKKPKG